MSRGRQEQIAELLDNLAQTLGSMIILIPHDYGVTPLHNDRLYAKQVLNMVNNKERIMLIDDKYTAEEVKGIIRQCDLFIGEKLHACISALSQCIPTIGLGYSSKFQGIFKQVEQERYLCSGLINEEIVAQTEHTWVNKEQINQKLSLKMEEIRQRALLNGELTKQLVDDK